MPEVVRIAVDSDCPKCGYPERWYDLAEEMFGCLTRAHTTATNDD